MYRVLIVDDEPKIRRGLSQWVAAHSGTFQVCGEAQNGREAEKLVCETMPHVALMDVCMPGRDGLETAAQLQQMAPDMLIVIITGHDHFEYAHRAIKLHVHDYLLKPVGQKDFNRLLDQLSEKLGPQPAREDEQDQQPYSCLVRSVVHYIDDHYQNHALDLTHVAAIFNVSKNHISKVMKQETGRSFTEYLMEIRLKQAASLLKKSHPRTSIYQVAAQVGYQSQHYFSRVFKNTYGVAPTEYRDLYGQPAFIIESHQS